jgi:hypothetical protein
MATSSAMIATTTNTSMSVNARDRHGPAPTLGCDASAFFATTYRASIRIPRRKKIQAADARPFST